MLSILIPIYNFDVRAFVLQLSNQAQDLETEVEIICLDDHSELEFHAYNKVLSGLFAVEYHRSKVNLGRSAVRNRLAEMAKFEHMLFLDCDGECMSKNYLSNYLKLIPKYDVIYGGRVYQEFRPDDPDLHFHWFCGTVREEIPVEIRTKNPYKSFMTNNFLIRKEVYNQVKMDESIAGYGHEDTFFAIELKSKGFKIDHIDNPIKHIGIETTEVFLEKSENGVKNLAFLVKEKHVGQSIKLVKFYYLAKKTGLLRLIKWIVTKRENAINKNFHSPTPDLYWFDLWKLVKLDFYLNKA